MTQKKIRINLEDSSGGKYKFDLEGNVTRDKVLKLFELMDVMDIEQEQETPNFDTLGVKLTSTLLFHLQALLTTKN